MVHHSLVHVLAASASLARLLERFGRIARDRIKAPRKFAVLCVECGEESADSVLAAAYSDHRLAALDHARRHRDRVGHCFGRYARFPKNLARRGIQASQTAIDHRCDDLAFIHGDAAIHDAAADSRPPDLLINVRIGTPQFLMGVQVDRVDDAPRRDAVKHAVEDNRCSLLMRLRVPDGRSVRYLIRPR